jgi:hypothetical protein
MRRKRIRVLLFLAFFSVFFSYSLTAQPEHKIRDAIQNLTETHVFRIGIFRIQPLFTIGSAYDSNAFSTQEFEVSDYYGSIAPGASVLLKLGHRAYFVVQEDLNFVVYRDQDELNDVFNETSGMFGIGSRRLLLNIGGSYSNKKARIDEEFDQLSQQKLTEINAEFSYALRKQTDILFSYRQNKSIYEL